jgi:hypothetical protein
MLLSTAHRPEILFTEGNQFSLGAEYPAAAVCRFYLASGPA